MPISQLTWSRRSFIIAFTGTSATLLLSPLAGWGLDAADPRVAAFVAAFVAATIGIVAHNHIEVPLTSAEVPGPPINLAGELKRSGLTAICMTFAVDYQAQRYPSEAYEWFLNGLARRTSS